MQEPALLAIILEEMKLVVGLHFDGARARARCPLPA